MTHPPWRLLTPAVVPLSQTPALSDPAHFFDDSPPGTGLAPKPLIANEVRRAGVDPTTTSKVENATPLVHSLQAKYSGGFLYLYPC